MRTRFAVLAALCGLVATASPAVASAAPVHNHGLTIAATPDPIVEGQGVLIYGQLKGINVANRRIDLYHRVGRARYFTLIGKTTTNAEGFYEFSRLNGVVITNRDWYVVGPGHTHSRTVHELVASAVTLATSSTTAETGHPVTFTGTVAPNHVGQRVLIQKQDSLTGSGWATIASGITDSNSSFTIVHRFGIAGDYTLRAYFPRDPRNIAGSSDSVTLPVQQAQNPDFTIASSNPLISAGQSVMLTGTLSSNGHTQASVPVTLYGQTANGKQHALATSVTGTDGSYSFTQVPVHNTVYRVETDSKPAVKTALLYEGVADVVTLTPSAMTVQQGQSVTFAGVVAPGRKGQWVFLQRQGPNGNWQSVEAVRLSAASRYSFVYRFARMGTFTLRARVFGTPMNVSGASTPVAITVSGVAPTNSLPPAPAS